MTDTSLDANNESEEQSSQQGVVIGTTAPKTDQMPALDVGSHTAQEPDEPHGDERRQTEEVIIAPNLSVRLHLSYRVGFLLASMVAGLSSVCIKQLLLPLQVSQLAPSSINTSFAIVSVIGALAGLLAAPLTGALSDRTISRWGRRRPWIAVGILIGVIGLVIMAFSTTIPMLIVGEILEQIGVDAVLSNVTALIPDQVPESKRANTSALNGMAPIVGGVVGLVLVTVFTNTHIVTQGYLLLAVVSLLCVDFFLLVLREPPLHRSQVAPFRLQTFIGSFVHPLRSPNFVLTLCSRLLVFLSYTIIGSYLLFYIRGVLHAPVAIATHGVTTYQLISTGVVIVVALVAGVLSQRVDRLKPFVFVGALVMALAIFLLVLFPTWSVIYTAAAIFGGGFGLYLGVDIALAVRVLPSELSRGKDLGIIYTAIFFPLIITPLLGASILNNWLFGKLRGNTLQ